jgi:hypothetical protein
MRSSGAGASSASRFALPAARALPLPPVASWDDVRRIALALPETAERTSHGTAAWRVRDRGFVWERPLRPADLRALGDRAPTGPILGARVEHLIAKEALLADDPEVYFTTPHFDGYPAVLVRLERIPLDELEELIVEAWLSRAPRRLAREYLAGRPGRDPRDPPRADMLAP